MNMDASLPSLAELLPHSAPMILLDELVSADASHVHARVMLRADSLFCEGGAIGAWVGIEYMAQAVGVWAGFRAWQKGERVKIGFLLGTRRYEALRPAFLPGQVLDVHIEVELMDEQGLGAFACRIDCAGETLARATITVFEPRDAGSFLQGATA